MLHFGFLPWLTPALFMMMIAPALVITAATALHRARALRDRDRAATAAARNPNTTGPEPTGPAAKRYTGA